MSSKRVFSNISELEALRARLRNESSLSRNQGSMVNENGESTDSSSSNSNSSSSSSSRHGPTPLPPSILPLKLTVTPTTGGRFDIYAPKCASVDDMRTYIARKLRVPRERIRLLHKDRQLVEGSLDANGLTDGSQLILLPHVEAGLASLIPSSQTPLQAVDNLTDTQVNEFLTGRSPLTLAMRLGDHVIFMQLQLSTTPTANGRRRSYCRKESKPSPLSSPNFATSTTTTAMAGNASSGRRNWSDNDSDAGQQSSSSFSTSSSACSSPTSPTSPFSSLSQKLLSSNPAEASWTRLPNSPAPAATSAERSTCYATTENCSNDPSNLPFLSADAVEQARRCLAQKLRQLSHVTQSSHAASESRGHESDAVIDSMRHIGHGIFSGTFSGTLNPSLQDRDGKPKRDISTIIHILNDLLGATPYSPTGAAPHSPVNPQSPSSPSPSVSPLPHPSSLHNSPPQQTYTANYPLSDSSTPCDASSATRDKVAVLRAMLEERRQRRLASRVTPSADRDIASAPSHSSKSIVNNKREVSSDMTSHFIPEKKAKCVHTGTVLF